MIEFTSFLPMYGSSDEWLRNRKECEDKTDFYPVSLKGMTPPFIIYINDFPMETPNIFGLFSYETNEMILNLSNYWGGERILYQISKQTNTYIYHFNGLLFTMQNIIADGFYYYKLVAGNKHFISEIFRIENVSSVDKIHDIFSSLVNSIKSGIDKDEILLQRNSSVSRKMYVSDRNCLIWGFIGSAGLYTPPSGFFQYFYFDYPSQVSYKMEIEGKDNSGGNFIVESKKMLRTIQYQMLLPEYAVEGITAANACDLIVLVEKTGKIYFLDEISVKTKWLDDNCLAEATLEFTISDNFNVVSSVC